MSKRVICIIGSCSDEGQCLCSESYEGELCDIPVCPMDCNSVTGNGICRGEEQGCDCNAGFSGTHTYMTYYTDIHTYIHIYIYIYTYPRWKTHFVFAADNTL